MLKRIIKTFITTDDCSGFYQSTIPAGTTIYANRTTESAIRHGNKLNWRFVFDTIKGAKAHDVPKGNKRLEAWFSDGKWEKPIKPLRK